MEKLIIEGTVNLPSINFDATTNLLSIKGRSIPEHPVKYYQPIERWIVEYLKNNPSKLFLNIHLDYLNTHSTECLLIIFKLIERYYKSTNADVKVIWDFDEDDEDMQDLGKDLSSIISVPFEIKEIRG